MHRLVACLALLPALALAGKKDAVLPVPVVLAPLPAGIRCDGQELGKALSKGLGNSKRFRLVPAGTEGALRLEIRDCVRVEPRGRILSSGGGAADQPSTSQLGSESPLGRGGAPLPTVVLHARLVGQRSTEVVVRGPFRALGDAVRKLRSSVESTIETLAPEQPAPSPFAVALAYPDPGPGRRAVTLSPTSAPETLYVTAENVITLADVEEVAYRTDVDPEGLIEVRLKPDGRDRLARATAGHVGGRMVIFLQGVVHLAPIVQMPIQDGTFHLTGGEPAGGWEELAAKLDRALRR
jgi:hypothetical protein